MTELHEQIRNFVETLPEDISTETLFAMCEDEGYDMMDVIDALDK